MKYMKEIKQAQEIAKRTISEQTMIYEKKNKIWICAYAFDYVIEKKNDRWFWGVITSDDKKAKIEWVNAEYYSFVKCLKQVFREIQLEILDNVFEDYE